MVCLTRKLVLIHIGLLLLVSCSGEKIPETTISLPNISDVSESAWRNLAKKNIFFGHQSVGFNIIEGIRNVMKVNKLIKLNIVYGSFAADFESSVLAHHRIGNNKDPLSKIDAFADFMSNKKARKVDIAFFKFCYVDITGNTNIQYIFNTYKKRMLNLKQRYPETTFIHVTVPVTIMKIGVKTWIKELLSKKYIWEYDDNIQRKRFNDLLTQEFKDSDPVFDLAVIESSFPNGKMCSFIRNGRIYYSLVPDYTNDGSHLNALGGRIVAEQLLLLLADLSSQ